MNDEIEKEMNEDIIEESESYPVMPLRNTVLFPQQVIPIYIGREKSLKLINELPANSKHIVVVAQEDGSIEDPNPDEMYTFGTLAVVLKVFDMPDNSKSAIVQGIDRVKILSFKEKEPYYRAVVQRLSDNVPSEDIELDAMGNNLRQVFGELIQVAPNLSEEHTGMLSNIQKPSRLADRTVSLLTVPNPEKQEVLEELDVKKRVEKAIKILTKEIQRIKLGEEIQTEVHDEISKSQREYYLREQMKAIKRELGEDESQVELKDIEEAIKKAKMPEEAEKVALKELDRLTKIPTQSPEYTVSRTYLDWLTELPWSITSEDSIDVKDAKSILDKDHYGLEKVKERILEYLAVRALKMQKDPEGALRGPLLCFAGPPGVGKTSLGQSIARSMGREFVRISLGGVRDEAEIRGHRRTYIGALPGRIIQSLKKVGTNNPVFMLDEIDKLGSDFRGDPSSALLEVLDPEQNSTFADHYLEVDFDLSKVMFIATANYRDPIPPALKDRMEIIEFSGYIEDEKAQIAKKHLIPKQMKENALTNKDVSLDDKGVKELINSYTREAGVRNLEREIANVFRKVARDKIEKNTKKIKVSKKKVTEYLGAPRFYSELAERTTKPGVVTGLAWTAAGGDILFIEASKMKGKGRLTLTGQLGDVMKESATAAMTYVRSHTDILGLDEDFNENTDIHVHVPAGAIPKDGPSAGVGMFIAIVSLLTGFPVKNRVAMTGEITLRGNVLPIGGVKEKVTAAHRAGIKTIILPDHNRKDLEEIPDHIKKDLDFHFAKEMMDVTDIALPGLNGRKKPRKSSEKVKKKS
ncbi:MAG: endopeptidase La [Candidatus Marinimicrobia bacterium]|jgi:ATP-dependent Lon protease|nr:endopeptidase La [Candidatus Neomarinimicrobiota bacterium]MBT3947691.1 endopeptidase La [Candidatus Neomarinimicrobiota bacterium]MBT4064717.1 endopeptidase La [Candidatus Neomarinimicrobiota bacterium]MBT4307238.1 endopeptidase La [Candidatus Neomarinimicrobiota bacterium]MBT5387096.1 endopeptidase La [Candidatus Neomarinimicrobiota bacterium]